MADQLSRCDWSGMFAETPAFAGRRPVRRSASRSGSTAAGPSGELLIGGFGVARRRGRRARRLLGGGLDRASRRQRPRSPSALRASVSCIDVAGRVLPAGFADERRGDLDVGGPGDRRRRLRRHPRAARALEGREVAMSAQRQDDRPPASPRPRSPPARAASRSCASPPTPRRWPRSSTRSATSCWSATRVGMVLHGLPNTVGVTLEMMILHGQAVMRASRRALVVVDMPFGSLRGPRTETAYANAARMLKETGAPGGEGRSRADASPTTIAYLIRARHPGDRAMSACDPRRC